MKSYEKESLKKSFLLFFSVQFVFLSIVIYQHYNKVLHEYEMHVGNKIMQCHLDKKCEDFNVKFIKDVGKKKLHTFYKDDEVYMLFRFKESYIKMYISQNEYIKNQYIIQKHIAIEYTLYLIALILESFLFALYALRPLKKALQLNEEFVKDILHDFNTPLSALKINLKILKKKFGENDAIKRSDEAIENILALQENLHYYIKQSKLQVENIELDKFLEKRSAYFETLFKDINIRTELEKFTIEVNRDVLTRIVDNIISNACKYNKKKGSVFISLKNNILLIEDSGIGIKNPQKIFQRHYKEQNRGIGIGLHIVQKLCEELDIKIEVESQIGIGSAFTLKFPLR